MQIQDHAGSVSLTRELLEPHELTLDSRRSIAVVCGPALISTEFESNLE